VTDTNFQQNPCNWN